MNLSTAPSDGNDDGDRSPEEAEKYHPREHLFHWDTYYDPTENPSSKSECWVDPNNRVYEEENPFHCGEPRGVELGADDDGPNTYISDVSDVSSDVGSSEPEVISSMILTSYLFGQLANVAKAAVWWSSFGVLVLSLLSTPHAVGITRVAFNWSLMLFSPLAAAVCERSSMRKILNATTLGRAFVWCALIPVAWLVINNHFGATTLFVGVFMVLMFFDGIQVAFSNVVDADCGGLDILASQYDLRVGNTVRLRFHSLHQTVFDLSFIVFTPPIALAFMFISRLSHTSIDHSKTTEKTRLLLGVSGVFVLLSLISVACYSFGIPRGGRVEPAELVENGNSPTAPLAPRSLLRDTAERFGNIKEGFRIIKQHSSLGWRLVFLALETGLEDSMVSVVIPHIALYSLRIVNFNYNLMEANLYAVLMIAVGKMGGMLAGVFMHRAWIPPEDGRNEPYKRLFWCVLVSSAAPLLIPLGSFLLVTGRIPVHGYQCLTFISSFVFFVFSTAPKIGFASLLQNLASTPDLAGKVYGFVGTFVTLIDAAVICCINSIFAFRGDDIIHSLLIVGCVYFLYGLFEAVAGPCLILKADSPPSQILPEDYGPEHEERVGYTPPQSVQI